MAERQLQAGVRRLDLEERPGPGHDGKRGALVPDAEDIQDAELQSRYGGVGGPLFRAYGTEVERRLWSCPAYRALAAAAPSLEA